MVPAQPYGDGVTEDRRAEAINIVARWATAIIIDDSLNHEDFPEIGDRDFREIVERASRLSDRPRSVEYRAAYKFLSDHRGDYL